MPQADFEKIATDILLKNRGPMYQDRLRKAFYDTGHPIPGKNPRKNFNLKLHRARWETRTLMDTDKGLWPADHSLP
jgi:hypothetical protein